jgi:hypothetical protein
MKKEAKRQSLIERIKAENAYRKELQKQVAELVAEESEWIEKLQETSQL